MILTESEVLAHVLLFTCLGRAGVGIRPDVRGPVDSLLLPVSGNGMFEARTMQNEALPKGIRAMEWQACY